MGKGFTPKCAGVTLVELLIGMVLGLVVTAGSIQVFLFVKQVFIFQQGLARIQENARVASIILGKEIRTAGNLGCRMLSSTFPVRIHPEIEPSYYNLTDAISVKTIHPRDLIDHPFLSSKIRKGLIENSDILWINSIQESFPLAKSTIGEEGFLLASGEVKFKKNQLIVLSDCQQADILSISADTYKVPRSPFSKIEFGSKKALSKQYDEKTAEVSLFSSKVFYVANTFRKNGSGDFIYALYSKDFNERTWELIEGIENIQLDFGLNRSGKFIHLPAREISDWQNISSVRLSLLFNSIEAALLKPQAYKMKQEMILPTDRLLRKWWIYEWPIKGHT